MGSNILSSWKEISAYTGFTDRTLQRWELRFGFPVHRPSGKARSSVSALVTEIDAWLSAAPCLPEIRQTVARYPGKLPKHLRQQFAGGLVPSGADSPPFVSATNDVQCAAEGTNYTRPSNLELVDALISGIYLMKLLKEEQARERTELVTLRTELAKTREISAQTRRNLKLPQPLFYWTHP